jgi:ABC-2 type transport system ATP-binding protein
MVEVTGVTKRYGPLVAVDDISFSVGRGEVFGFIGPNGAGKTTTMRILTGFIPATFGVAKIGGFDVFENPQEVKRQVGYLPETPPLYLDLSVGDYLRFVAEIRGFSRADRIRRVGEVMEQVGLGGWEDRILGSLSKGYRQRVGIAQAIIHKPALLILDEPTSGLDPVQTMGVRELIKGLDSTVILSTHILSEVEALCSSVVMINEGKIAASGTVEELCAMAGAPEYRVVVESGAGPFADLGIIAAKVGGLNSVDLVTQDGKALLLSASSDPRAEVASLCAASGWRLLALERNKPSLRDAFVAVVGGA